MATNTRNGNAIENSTLISRSEVGNGLAILKVRPDGWELPSFEPGQFAVLGLWLEDPFAEQPEMRLVRRAYSITSSPELRTHLEFYVREVEGGALSPHLLSLRPGDRLWLSQKILGAFTMRLVPPDRNLVMIGTGTGIAPYLSMLRAIPEGCPLQRVAVIQGARTSPELGFREELEALDDRCSQFLYFPVISRPTANADGWKGATGHVQSVWRSGNFADRCGERPSPGDTHVLLCGIPNMVDDMLRLLSEEGFRQARRSGSGEVHVERF